jgi:hypothetical protein
MQKITFLFFILSVFFGFSQNTVTVDGTKTWSGYVNAFNVSDGSYAFGFPYPTSDLKAVISATSVRVSPNTAIWGAESTDPNWFDNPGNPPSNPNKYIEANTFVEDNTLAGSDLTFIGTINENDIDNAYTAIAFIKALDPNSGYATVTFKSEVIGASGTFNVSALASELTNGFIIQYGFALTGPIIDPADEPTIGSIEFTPASLSTKDLQLSEFNVFPNPTNNEWNIKSSSAIINNIQLFDVLGKQVLNSNPNSTLVELNALTLPKGLYLAKIESDAGSITKKLIKN